MWPFSNKKKELKQAIDGVHQYLSKLDIKIQSYRSEIMAELRKNEGDVIKVQSMVKELETMMKYAGLRLDVITLGEAYLLAKQEDRKIWDKARALLEEMGFRAEKMSERKPRQFSNENRQ